MVHSDELKSIEGVKILIVEDNVLNQRIVNLVLTKMGAICESVANGAEAIEKIIDTHFDIILMDINMPVMDGYETARHLRQVLKNQTPIIALTADTFSADDEDYKKDGINAMLTKPFEFDYFTELVNSLICKPS